MCVYFLDLFNKVNFPFSLVVADGCSELCLASEANENFLEVGTITYQSNFISNVII